MDATARRPPRTSAVSAISALRTASQDRGGRARARRPGPWGRDRGDYSTSRGRRQAAGSRLRPRHAGASRPMAASAGPIRGRRAPARAPRTAPALALALPHPCGGSPGVPPWALGVWSAPPLRHSPTSLPAAGHGVPSPRLAISGARAAPARLPIGHICYICHTCYICYICYICIQCTLYALYGYVYASGGACRGGRAVEPHFLRFTAVEGAADALLRGLLSSREWALPGPVPGLVGTQSRGTPGFRGDRRATLAPPLPTRLRPLPR
jgi:hypothetical protein